MLIRAQNKSSEQIRSFMNFSETKSIFTYEWAFHRNSQNSNPPTLSGKIQFGKLLSDNSSNPRFLCTVNLNKKICQLIPPGGLNLFLIQGTNTD